MNFKKKKIIKSFAKQYSLYSYTPILPILPIQEYRLIQPILLAKAATSP